MKRSGSRGILLLLLIVGTCFSTATVWARLPKPVRSTGAVLAIDVETQTIVVKQADGKKPLLLDWNKATEFTTNGHPASVSSLKQGTLVVVVYRHVSFHNPLLKKVEWEETKE